MSEDDVTPSVPGTAENSNVSTPLSTGLSAIALLRDVGEAVAWLWKENEFAAKERVTFFKPEKWQAEGEPEPLYLHPTIPLTNTEVGELVERLKDGQWAPRFTSVGAALLMHEAASTLARLSGRIERKDAAIKTAITAIGRSDAQSDALVNAAKVLRASLPKEGQE